MEAHQPQPEVLLDRGRESVGIGGPCVIAASTAKGGLVLERLRRAGPLIAGLVAGALLLVLVLLAFGR